MLQYVDAYSGETADSVYVMTIEGEEIASVAGHAWTEEHADELLKEHGHGIYAVFVGGTLNGCQAL